MGARLYFYKDENGVTHKYIYCSLCGSGPYMKEDQGTHFRYATIDEKSIYCHECIRTLDIRDDTGNLMPVPDQKKTLPEVEATPNVFPSTEEPKESDPLDNCRETLRREIAGTKTIPFGSRNITYILEHLDGSYTTGVGKKGSILTSNSEMVFYRTDKDKKRAEIFQGLIDELDDDDRNSLIEKFSQQFFN